MSLGRVGERRALEEGRDGLGAGPEGRPESRHGYHHAARHHGWNDEREIHPSTRALRHTDAKRGSFKAVFPTLLPSKSRHIDAIIHNSRVPFMTSRHTHARVVHPTCMIVYIYIGVLA